MIKHTLIKNDDWGQYGAGAQALSPLPNEIWKIKYVLLCPGNNGGVANQQSTLMISKRGGITQVPILVTNALYTLDGIEFFYEFKAMYLTIDLEEGDTIYCSYGAFYFCYDRYSTVGIP